MKVSRPGFLGGLLDRLVVRLLILMSAALLPLGAISVSTTRDALRTAQRGVERGLIGHAGDAVTGKWALVESALSSAWMLAAAVSPRLDDIADCQEFLADFINASGVYSSAAYVRLDGQADCISSGPGRNMAQEPFFRALMADQDALVTLNPTGLIRPAPVVLAAVPVLSDGEVTGFLALAIARRSMELLGATQRDPGPDFAVVVNRNGEPLTLDPLGDDSDYLPRTTGLADLVAQGSRVVQATAASGTRSVYAVAELIPGRLFALGVWPSTAEAVVALQTSRLPLVFPVLMWLASLGVVLMAFHHLVLRHLRRLNGQLRRFTLGRRDDWPDLERGAPAEFRELNTTFRRMALIIAKDEAEREASLREKTVLLKEIHHRVKNNLQLIASIVNLQIRPLRDPASRRVLQTVQERVLGLAAIHRALYEEKTLAQVRADRVLDDALGRIVALGSAPGVRIEVIRSLDPVTLTTDQMVPLSFLVTEAVTNSMNHLVAAMAAPVRSGQAAGAAPLPWLEVELTETVTDERVVTVQITNALIGTEADVSPLPAEDRARAQIGLDLIAAFATQLGGDLTTGRTEDHPRGEAWRLRLVFRAEERAAE